MCPQYDVEQPFLPAYGSAAQSGRKTSVGHIGQGVFRTARRNVQAVAVPQSALCHRPSEGDFVWKIDPATGTIARQPVTLGKLLPDGRMSVESGLSASEIVAVSGLRFLSDGMKIQIDDSPKVQPVENASR